MPFVLTVDQVDSQRRADAVESALTKLHPVSTLLPFVRTVGDEFQGLLADPLSVVTVILDLMRTQQWHIGLGVGAIETPLPADSRTARGPAFVAARAAVERAKREVAHVAVVATDPAAAEAFDVEVVLRLVSALRVRRSEQGWEAVDLAAGGLSQADIATRLGISRQAVGQRLAAAQWQPEADAVPVLGRLLARTGAAAGGTA